MVLFTRPRYGLWGGGQIQNQHRELPSTLDLTDFQRDLQKDLVDEKEIFIDESYTLHIPMKLSEIVATYLYTWSLSVNLKSSR